ncbi:cytidylate kinase-like family protein [Butyrivibrio sp. NC3005]|uniref:cytidylate kinase-like family protein n=1 Tax=Butyrivibrio sp. NC3005 TaxID=1280685 RepID=UPI00040F4F28|nr:cytidylate kinase-like family protein [Butyrivibrio sp. NC3005]
MKRNIVIAIARQYGSGGRTVGEMLADELGINYYDNGLVKLASELSGISETMFVKADENILNGKHLLDKVKWKKNIYKGGIIPPDSDNFTSMKNLFNYQAEVIKQLAEKESCVIVGRCADFVLKDYENAISVFVHADHDFLMEQAAKKQAVRGEELAKTIEKIDKYRSDYYEYYTGKKWTDALNYDLCLDSGKLGFKKCVEAIKAYMKVRYGNDILD